MYNSPLEQFEILPLLSFGANLFDFSITNDLYDFIELEDYF